MAETMKAASKKWSNWGGKRAGAGRKPGPEYGNQKITTVVLTNDTIEEFRRLGGSAWLRKQIRSRALFDRLMPADAQKLFKTAENKDASDETGVPKELGKDTYIFRPLGFGCSYVGFENDDTLLVDTALEARINDIVALRSSDRFWIGKLTDTAPVKLIVGENNIAKEIVFADGETPEIVGVVTLAVKSLRQG